MMVINLHRSYIFVLTFHQYRRVRNLFVGGFILTESRANGDNFTEQRSRSKESHSDLSARPRFRSSYDLSGNVFASNFFNVFAGNYGSEPGQGQFSMLSKFYRRTFRC